MKCSRGGAYAVPAEALGMKGAALRIFGGLARSYDRTVDFATLFQDRRWKRWAAGRVRAGGGEVVLDLGCGTLLLEERMRATGCSFVGVDLTEEMIRGGQSKGLGNVPLLVNGDAESLPFRDASFDSVVSCYVPKYVGVGRLARELAQVTKPGGVVALYDFARPRGPAAPFLRAYIEVGLRGLGYMLGLAGMREASTFRELPGIVEKTRWDYEVEGAMKGAGFETLEVGRLTGGVVFAYCGRRTGGTVSPASGIRQGP